MDSLVDDNFSEIRKTFTDPLYNAMGLHVDMGASFHDCGTRDDYGIGCCATLDGVTHYAKAWPIEDHDSRWGACMGSFTFDESLAGNGVDYVSPDSLAKIMGDYGYHDSRSFLDCNLDVWSDELVGILGYEVFGSSQSEALVLSPLADKESVLQLFYTFSEKADGLISDELFNTLYWEMEAEERFALILNLLAEKRTATVQELCEALNASESTIRRDLTELARQGRLNKVHGGATLPDGQFLADAPPMAA